jgi:tetratricopeptide (TPR) repeat protein
MAQYAWENAAKQFQQALTSLELVEEADRRKECDLLLRLGEALNYLSTGSGDAPAEREAFYRAADIARDLGLPEQLARAAIGARGHNPAIAFGGSKLLDLLEEANVSLGRGDSILHSLVLTNLAGYLMTSKLRSTEATKEELARTYARSQQLKSEAVAMARRLNDPQALATALVEFLGLDLTESPRDVCREAREAIDLAASAGAVEIQFEGARILLFALLQLVDRDGADRALTDLALMAQQYRQPVFEWSVTSCEAMFALMDGRIVAAERQVYEAGQRAKTQTYTHFYLLFALGRFQGRFDPSVATRINEFLASEHNANFGQILAALLALEHGDIDAAREQFDSLATNEFRDLLVDVTWLTTVVQCAEVAAWLGDRERSTLLYEILAPYADQCVTFSGASEYHGAAAFYLGLLATTLERWDAAEEHFERAIDLDTTNRAWSFVATERYHYAGMLVRRGAPGDRERALSFVDQALAAAEDMGMAPLAQRALALKVQVQGILKA